MSEEKQTVAGAFAEAEGSSALDDSVWEWDDNGQIQIYSRAAIEALEEADSPDGEAAEDEQDGNVESLDAQDSEAEGSEDAVSHEEESVEEDEPVHDYEKRFKDTQGELTRTRQELADARRQLSQLTAQLASGSTASGGSQGQAESSENPSGFDEDALRAALASGDSDAFISQLKQALASGQGANQASAPVESPDEARVAAARAEIDAIVAVYPDFWGYKTEMEGYLQKNPEAPFIEAYEVVTGRRPGASSAKQANTDSQRKTKVNPKTVQKRAQKLRTESGVSASRTGPARPRSIKEAFNNALEGL